MPAANRIRLLGCCGRFFRLYSLAFPVHFCLVAQIGGAFDAAKLSAAFDQVRRRHPALRGCIVDAAETGPAFYETDNSIEVQGRRASHDTDNSIEVHAAPVDADIDWRGVVESELPLPFDTIPGPLMRATALCASYGASIVLTFHHAIADALSGTRILDDLMRALAGEHLDALSPLPPIEEMLAISASNSPVPQHAASRTDIAPPSERFAPASDKLAVNIAILEWDQKETARLIQCCRENGTTVHGAICAAASRHLPPSDANAIRMHCPMDLSRIASVEAGHCGVFIGAGIVAIPTARQQPLWRVAREIVDGLRAARSPAAVAAMLQWIAAEFPPTAGRQGGGRGVLRFPTTKCCSHLQSRRPAPCGRLWAADAQGDLGAGYVV